jgi:MFS family permease
VSDRAEARSPLRADLRYSLIDAVVFSVMVGCGETYLAPFALAIGMSEVSAGLVATLPMVAGGAFQLLAPSALGLARSYRAWVCAWVVVQAVAFVPLLIGGVRGAAPAALVFGAASLYWAAGMALSPAWNAWMSALIPPRLRARYFARRQAAAQLGIVAGLVGGGFALHAATARGHRTTGFAILFAAALAFRLVSVAMLARQSRPAGNPRPHALALREVLGRVRRSDRLPVILCLAGMTAAVNLAGPFLTPFLLVERGLSYGGFTAQLTCFFVGKIASYHVLSRRARGVDVKLLLFVGGIGIAPLPLLWCWAEGVRGYAAIQLLSGVSWAAFELGTILSFLDVADERERTSLLAVYNALNSLAMAVASIVGGIALGVLGHGLAAYVGLFVVCAGARAIMLVVLLYRARHEAIRAIPAIRTLAVRPWGGGVVVAILATLGLRDGDDAADDDGA